MSKENTKEQLLVVEDDEGLQRQLRWSLDDYNVLIAKNRNEAIAFVRRYQPAVVTLDLGLPPDAANVSEGFATLEEIQSLSPDTKIIVITGNDDRENAVKAIGLGAYDFYQKPVDPDILKIIIERAYRLFKLEQENKQLLSKESKSVLDGLVTIDEKMLKICRTVEKIAPTDVSTLLLGESGTGKEILAKSLHALSRRAENNFVAINCAAIPDTLLESELFGYEKGAFTGANKQTIGKIEMAHGGTLFLDEIGDLPFPLQAKLLRFLQERVIERVGGRSEIAVDVRVVSATHRNIKEMIAGEQFREDLFYRLSEISIEIPPLRERAGDAIVLARYFVDKYTAQINSRVKGLANDARNAIEKYNWPGNVRELDSSIKRAVIMAEAPLVCASDLGLELDNKTSEPLNLREVREKAEKEAIKLALGRADGNISKTSELLGISRPTLYDLMDKYDLK